MVHLWNDSNRCPIVISFVQQMLVTRNIGQEKLHNVNSLTNEKLIMGISISRTSLGHFCQCHSRSSYPFQDGSPLLEYKCFEQSSRLWSGFWFQWYPRFPKDAKYSSGPHGMSVCPQASLPMAMQSGSATLDRELGFVMRHELPFSLYEFIAWFAAIFRWILRHK